MSGVAPRLGSARTAASVVRGAVPGLSVALVALGMLVSQAVRSAPSPAAEPCVRAGLVDGQLRCGDELPSAPADLCPGPGPVAHTAIASGDALHTAQLCAHPSVAPGDPGWARMAPSDLAALHLPVDVNGASEHELTSLPRVGPVLARRIVAGRPYADLDDLLSVRGIGPATIERLRSRVTFARARL